MRACRTHRVRTRSRAARTGGQPGGTLATLDIDGWTGWRLRCGAGAAPGGADAAGCPGGSLFAGHIAALDALVTGWHGQRGQTCPGASASSAGMGSCSVARITAGSGAVVSGAG